jgi:hypothetical protein
VLACVATALPAAAAPAAGPRVTVTVVGPGGKVVRAPRAVRAAGGRVRIDGRVCGLPGATPLAALAALRLPLGITASGGCTPSAYFVTRIGRRANAGRNGWAYKVGRRAGTASAANPSGSFGTGRRLRGGEVVTWFWCVLGARGCQRTMTARRVGAATVRVRGYDDAGRGVRVPRALVTATDSRGRRARGRTGARGTVRLRGLRGAWKITARRGGFVPALPGGAR